MEDCQTPTSKKSNIEICDIYDIYGNRTGKTFIRGEPLSDGQFVMVVDVWIVNSKDEILIQKRSPYKKDLPDTWATHSGCVLAGESSQQACIREPLEEIGIHILPSQIHKLNRKLRGRLLSENFVVEQDFDVRDARFTGGRSQPDQMGHCFPTQTDGKQKRILPLSEFFDVVRFLEERRRVKAL